MMQSQPRSAALSRNRQYATFYVDSLFFGIEVCRVQEVLRYQEMTRVPLASPGVEGLINLRGQIVTAVDMRRRLGLKERETGRPPMNIVVRSEDGAVSLLVDEIGDVLEVPGESYEPAPDSLPRRQKELIDGIYKLESCLLLALDTDSVLAMPRPS